MKKIIYAVLVILAVMVLADRALKVYEKIADNEEVGSRCVTNPYLSPQQFRDYAMAGQYRLLPYTVFGLKPGFKSETVNINSLGLRGQEIGEKREGCYRVIVVGGSAVYGGEVPSDDLTFCKLLERKARDKYGRDIEVINAGVPAYISMQELILLEDELIGLKPDLVIVFDGANDVLSPLEKDKRPNYPWWFSEIERVYYKSVTSLFIEKKLRKYRPTKLLMNWLDRRKGEASWKEYGISAEQIRCYKRNLDLMCHLAKSYGIDVVLVFQPMAIYKEPLTPSEKKIIEGLRPDFLEAFSGMADLARDAMSRAAAENGVAFIDGTNFFNSTDKDIFIDILHFNQPGHAIVADILEENITFEKRSSVR